MNAIMIIGGTDSSGGAGLMRDTYVAHKFGCNVLPVVTAVTAQSNEKLFETRIMPTELIASQVHAALATAAPAAIKVGMLGNSEAAEAVAHAIQGQRCPVVIDPVLKSSSGRQLMSGQFPRMLLAQAHLITPNLPEAAVLSGYPFAQSDARIATQADWFLSQGVQAVLIKGGHASGKTATDHLFTASETHILKAPRLQASVRGTGCALATAIACSLAQGNDLYLACKIAKMFVHDSLREAANI